MEHPVDGLSPAARENVNGSWLCSMITPTPSGKLPRSNGESQGRAGCSRRSRQGLEQKLDGDRIMVGKRISFRISKQIEFHGIGDRSD